MTTLDLSRVARVRLSGPPDRPRPAMEAASAAAVPPREAEAGPASVPLGAAPPPPPAPAAPAAAAVPAPAGPAVTGHPNVLVVDDNVRLATTVAAFMEMEGFRVRAAHSAEDALLAARGTVFDLALVDINMPGIDGIEVCRRLREMSPGLRVLIVTGRDSVEDPQRAAAVGARRLLTKPISLASLRDEMVRALAV
jgi:CheY-like chemotaxis protein